MGETLMHLGTSILVISMLMYANVTYGVAAVLNGLADIYMFRVFGKASCRQRKQTESKGNKEKSDVKR